MKLSDGDGHVPRITVEFYSIQAIQDLWFTS
jgi:hypothetical protein